MTSDSRAQDRTTDDQEQRLRELCEQAFTFLDQLAECRAWNRHLQGKLDTAQAELEATQAELEATQAELEATQAELETVRQQLEAQGRESGDG